MKTIQITNNILNNQVENKPSRFDMAINFYCCVEKLGRYYLACYYYNPAWDMYYPFYDDVNKTPVLRQSISKTYGELIKETNSIIDIDINDKVELAKKRFKELIGCSCEVVQSKSSELFELKYSKTANLYSVYKLFNFIITQVEDVQLMLNPRSMDCKLFELDKLDKHNVVGNAVWFCKESLVELKQHAIKI